jgi:hypothetical protein
MDPHEKPKLPPTNTHGAMELGVFQNRHVGLANAQATKTTLAATAWAVTPSRRYEATVRPARTDFHTDLKISTRRSSSETTPSAR